MMIIWIIKIIILDQASNTMYVPQIIYIEKYICTSETKGNILNIQTLLFTCPLKRSFHWEVFSFSHLNKVTLMCNNSTWRGHFLTTFLWAFRSLYLTKAFFKNTYCLKYTQVMIYDLKIHRIISKIVLNIHIMGGIPWNLWSSVNWYPQNSLV